jgi:large subunit ribosomal protein L5
MTDKPRILIRYQQDVLPVLMEQFGYTNNHRVPRLVKIVVNRGIGDAVQDPKLLETAVEELAQVTGQRPRITRARRSVSNSSCAKGCRSGPR